MVVVNITYPMVVLTFTIIIFIIICIMSDDAWKSSERVKTGVSIILVLTAIMSFTTLAGILNGLL